MVTLDELHRVSITLDGHTHVVANANLCGNCDTLETLRSRVVLSFLTGIDRDEIGRAFDTAFDACERIPGDGAVGRADGSNFVLEVRRSIEA